MKPNALLLAVSLPFTFVAVAGAQVEKDVMIQTKFIEVTQEAAEELGFDWILNPFGVPVFDREPPGSGGSTTKPGSGGIPTTGGESGAGSGTIVDPSFEFAVDSLISSPDGSVNAAAPGVLSVAGILTDPQFQVIIRALDQKKGVDLVAAPSVVTRSGQRARIEIIREFIYPVEFDPPEIPQDFGGVGDGTFFGGGETQLNFGVGGAGNNLSEMTTTSMTVEGVRQVETTVTRRVRIGEVQNPNPNLARTQRQIDRVNRRLANAANPIQANQLLAQRNQLFQQANRQFQNPRNTPVFQDQEITFVENVPFEQEIQQMRIDGILDENSPKFAAGFTHYLTNNLGIGGQFEWIHGNLDDAFMGQAEVTYRAPMEFENFGLAPYVAGGIGGITGGGIDEFVGSIAGGVEFRNQSDVGIFTEYSHQFLGNGMDFGQVLAGINLVIKGGVPRRSPGWGGSPFGVTPATPTSFETRNVGVTLEVTPNVGSDSQFVDLELAPEVVEFEGFVNYGSPITTTEGGEIVLTEESISQGGIGALRGTGLGRKKPGKVQNRTQVPIFSSRRAETTVQIADGQTVAIGGLVEEDVQEVEDRVPFLGDLPLVGRLFRSKSEQRLKRNLVIFVTAELIDPAGE